jgi:membrane protein implicated in regulation of membrane protease activity
MDGREIWPLRAHLKPGLALLIRITDRIGHAPAMVCMWLATAALGTAVVTGVVPSLHWEYQALLFAALAIASLAVGRRALFTVVPLCGLRISIVGQRPTLAGPSRSTGRLSMDGGVSKLKTRFGLSRDLISQPERTSA